MIARVEQAEREEDFGGKAVQLGRARRLGLPVPPAWALSSAFVEAVVAGDAGAIAQVVEAFAQLGGPVAVRSSGIGEDALEASFAGQHATALNVRSREALLAAVATVHASARTEAALAYRRKLGLPAEPRMGIVVQRLVPATCAGVLFTRHPTTGADERVIEATWGLGEAVVAGLVTPDHYRLARGGGVLERRLGEKDLAILWDEAGGTREVEVDAHLVSAPCLDEARLAALEGLAGSCEAAFGGTQDLEWAFVHDPEEPRDSLYLLQRRAITRG
ncbi:PEP/pyruvate-binding domain-containing protein [Chondromyces apiculatus]|uniref:Phosphoenolpyruvate synthase n=1 Tax=Chondromyces apiculatus DSM 436 TaxID=1192034 RepID=A0A017TIF9_9BACT|nr:PEP/pyruvate-binding domain-containing protein [Chondromyces apiculatus]EYF08682.1 phosphoenolpyruvate synthase [Chondromyces apiculatus DSM 436]